MTSESQKPDYTNFGWKHADFQIFGKNPRMQFWFFLFFFFFVIMKENDYYNMHQKFQVHGTTSFGIGAKTNIARFQPSPYP